MNNTMNTVATEAATTTTNNTESTMKTTSIQVANNNGTVFTLAPCKGNKVPAHYLLQPSVDIDFDGRVISFLSNPERTIYTVCLVEGVWRFLTTDKNIQSSESLTTYIKPVKEVKVKAIKEPKAPKAADAPSSEMKRYSQYVSDGIGDTDGVFMPLGFEQWKKSHLNKPEIKIVKYACDHSTCQGTTPSMKECDCECHQVAIKVIPADMIAEPRKAKKRGQTTKLAAYQY